MESDRQITRSDVFLQRGLANFELEKYSEAIEDFKRITEPILEPFKHNNLGICYYQLGMYEEADKEYVQAIRTDANLVQAYYNLAILHIEEEKYERARKMLTSCLRIDRNFHAARKALGTLNGTNRNWWTWWFSENYLKRIVGGFVMLFLLAIVTIIGLIAIAGDTILRYPSNTVSLKIFFGLIIFTKSTFETTFGKQELTSNDLVAVTIVVFALMTLLLFPNLRKLKIGPYEVELLPADTGPFGVIELVKSPIPASPETSER